MQQQRLVGIPKPELEYMHKAHVLRTCVAGTTQSPLVLSSLRRTTLSTGAQRHGAATTAVVKYAFQFMGVPLSITFDDTYLGRLQSLEGRTRRRRIKSCTYAWVVNLSPSHRSRHSRPSPPWPGTEVVLVYCTLRTSVHKVSVVLCFTVGLREPMPLHAARCTPFDGAFLSPWDLRGT